MYILSSDKKEKLFAHYNLDVNFNVNMYKRKTELQIQHCEVVMISNAKISIFVHQLNFF